jgi:hypothetical protein
MTDSEPAERQLPDIVILGVGHSGTSIAARMLFELGWRCNDADARFCEPPGLHEINDRILRDGAADAATEAAMRGFLAGLASPFAIKDPRFVLTLGDWSPLLVARDPAPTLVWIVKDLEAVKASYLARDELFDGEPGLYGRRVEQLADAAASRFAAWPGPKLRLAYEDVARAVRLFRVEPGQRHPLGGLWV